MAYTETDKKNHIYEMQNYLRTISQMNGNIPSVVPSGVYDEQTEEAIRQFQREYGLPVTGKADFNTWETIVEVYLSAEEYYKLNSSVMLFPNSEYSINEGASGNPVYILQSVLNTVAEAYANTNAVPIDGVYGKATADAVRYMQDIVGEKSTGNMDYKTWNKLARLYNYHIMKLPGTEDFQSL